MMHQLWLQKYFVAFDSCAFKYGIIHNYEIFLGFMVSLNSFELGHPKSQKWPETLGQT